MAGVRELEHQEDKRAGGGIENKQHVHNNTAHVRSPRESR